MKTHNHRGQIFALALLIFLSTIYIVRDFEISFVNSDALENETLLARNSKKNTYYGLVASGRIPPADPIMEAVFVYQKNAIPRLTLMTLERKTGYFPRRSSYSASSHYIAYIIGEDGRVLASQEFSVKDNESLRTEFTVVLPWLSEYGAMQIRNMDGEILIHQPLIRLPWDNRPPSVKDALSAVSPR